jgi:hypothetical protein
MTSTKSERWRMESAGVDADLKILSAKGASLPARSYSFSALLICASLSGS